MNTALTSPLTLAKGRQAKPKALRTVKRRRKSWDYSEVFERDWHAALMGMGDGFRFTGVHGHKFTDEIKFSELYREIYKEICTRTTEGKRVICGPSLGRLYKFLEDNNRVRGSAVAMCPLLHDKLVFEKTVSAAEYLENQAEFPRVLGDGVEKIQRAGWVEFVDFPSRSVQLNCHRICTCLTEAEGVAILGTLETEPWLRATRKTMLLLWDFGLRHLKEWMGRELGEAVPMLWLGWKTGLGGLPVTMEAGGDLLSYATARTAWDD